MEIARSIWNYYHLLTVQELTDLCDLADRLKFAASATDYETSWIASLRAMIQQKMQYQPAEAAQTQPAAAPQPAATSAQSTYDSTQTGSQQADLNTTDDAVTAPEPELSSSRRSRSESLAAEARDWHAQRQDPLQMSPVAPPPESVINTAVEDIEGPTSRSRTQSNASHASQQRYVMDPYSNEAYMQPPSIPSNVVTAQQRQGSMDEGYTNSDDTSARSTLESTPSHHADALAAQQPMPDLSHY
ncbi:unnamed protein product, partial [Cylicostephanus goldi]